MLDKEFKYYRNRYRQLLKKYADRFIVIKGKKVIGHYHTHSEAYQETIKTEELGTFLIQKIIKEAGHERTRRRWFSFFD